MYSNKMGNNTTARQMWRKENGISDLSPLRWCFKGCCGRHKGSYDLNYGFNMPKWKSCPPAPIHLYLFNQARFFSSKLAIPSGTWLFIHYWTELWSYTDIGNFFAGSQGECQLDDDGKDRRAACPLDSKLFLQSNEPQHSRTCR